MNPKKILLILIIFSFLVTGSVEAVALKVSPTEIKIETEPRVLTKEEIIVENSGNNVALYEVYLDNFSDWIKVKPESFTLESREFKKVVLEIKNEKEGIFSTLISVVAKPLSQREFKANSGVKIPLEIRISEKEKIPFLATISQNFIDFFKSRDLIYVFSIILILTLARIWIQKRERIWKGQDYYSDFPAIKFKKNGNVLK